MADMSKLSSFQRSIAYVSVVGECWEWGRALTTDGYGRVCWKDAGRLRQTGAHRVSYELMFGKDGMGDLLVCHRCDNRKCINPEHLFLGTTATNMADMKAKGRAHKPKGGAHPQAKLSDAQAVAILSCSAAGHTARRIASIARLPIQIVRRVVRGATFKHLLGATQ